MFVDEYDYIIWQNVIVAIVLFLFTSGFILRYIKKSLTEITQHWRVLIYNLKYSTETFYDELTNEISDSNISGLSIDTTTKSTSNILFADRKYLRIECGSVGCLVCFAPYGQGSFVSYWMYTTPRSRELLLHAIPFIGPWLHAFIYKKTYYQYDTESMFYTYVRDAIMKMVDQLTEEHSIEAIPERDREALKRNIFDLR